MRTYFSISIYRLTILCAFFMLQTGIAVIAQESNENSVFEKVKWQEGPATAKLDKWAEINVPEGFLFADGSDTQMLMESMGNTVSEREVGFLGPKDLEWFVIFEFDEVGYVKDDEKNSLDADAILKTIQNGTEEGNKIRKEKGYPTLTLQGWELKPYYDENTHNLEWAIKGVDSTGAGFLNHNTRLLGRRGVMQVTLVVDPPMFKDVLPTYQSQLSEFTFISGEDYASFRQGDKLAGYGLAALVAGGAAAKLGFFKMIAKFSKVIFLAIAAFVGGFWKKIKRLFGKSE